jgi:hypothetical protein
VAVTVITRDRSGQGGGLQTTAVNSPQASNQAFLSQRNKGERPSARRSKDFGASRKNFD